MKHTDRLTSILFAGNILYIVGFILMFVFPQLTEGFKDDSYNDGIGIYTGVIFFLGTFAFANWIYCLWFCSKHDRYSGSLIWLIILNGLYAPFYYYDVKIKKRPLKNDLKRPEVNTTNKDGIKESDYADLMRNSVKEIIELWASMNEQIRLQEGNNKINITEELFTQWNDLNISKASDLVEVFNVRQRLSLKQFDNTIKETEKTIKSQYPKLTDFIETDMWKNLNELAKITLNQLK